MRNKVKLVEPSRNKSVKDHNKVTIRKKKKKINDHNGSRRRKRFVRSKQVVALPLPLPVPSTLQRLYDACRDAFKGPGTVPTPAHVHKLCRIIDGMLPEDVGLSRELQFFKSSGSVKGIPTENPSVISTTIYQCANFSLCIFFLPANGVIPLHNHPGMTVFSKLLLGTMHIKAYDLVDPIDSDGSTPQSKLRLARLKADSVFTSPCDTSVLYPTSGGNIHAFKAITPCALLDVLGPPYSKADGSYYKDTPYSALSKGLDGRSMIAKEEGHLYAWLEEIELPEELEMYAIRYLGPQINETATH